MKFAEIYQYCRDKIPSKEIQLNSLNVCYQHLRRWLIYTKIKFIYLYRLPRTRLISKRLLMSIAAIYFVMILLTIFINPNAYKQTLEQFVYDKTGQTLLLEGPLHLRSLPIALEAENIILKEPPRKNRTMLKVENLKIYPRFFSLLIGRLSFNVELKSTHYKSAIIPHLKTKIIYAHKTIELLGLQMKLKDGKQEGILEIDKFQIDMNEDVIKYHLSHQSNHCPLSLVLATLDFRNKIEGDASHIKCDLTAQGNSLRALKQTLSGELDMEMSNGNICGINLLSSLKEAKSIFGTVASGIAKPFVSIAKALKITHPHLEKTPFQTLKVSCKLHNGIVDNHHLAIHHHHYDLKGFGKMNVAHGTLDYRVQALYKDRSDPKYKKLKKAPLILHVSGPIENCHVRPDFDSYLHYIKQ